MTPKEQKAYLSELHQMSAFEVRENTALEMQPDSLKRAMAITELEKRRQARAPDTIRKPVNGLALYIALALMVAGAFAWWKFF